MFFGFDSDLDPTDSDIVVEMIQLLQVKDLELGEKVEEVCCGAVGCPDLPALLLCCCELNIKLSRIVAHRNYSLGCIDHSSLLLG